MDNKKKQRNKWLVLINIPIQMGIIIFLFSKLGAWLDEKYINYIKKMDKETKAFIATIGIALAILWIFKAKKNSGDKSKEDDVVVDKYQAPKVVAEDEKKLKDEAVIGLQAMRDAINKSESARELDKLKNMILQESGIKIMISKNTKKLRAMDKKGNVIAEEE